MSCLSVPICPLCLQLLWGLRACSVLYLCFFHTHFTRLLSRANPILASVAKLEHGLLAEVSENTRAIVRTKGVKAIIKTLTPRVDRWRRPHTRSRSRCTTRYRFTTGIFPVARTDLSLFFTSCKLPISQRHKRANQGSHLRNRLVCSTGRIIGRVYPPASLSHDKECNVSCLLTKLPLGGSIDDDFKLVFLHNSPNRASIFVQISSISGVHNVCVCVSYDGNCGLCQSQIGVGSGVQPVCFNGFNLHLIDSPALAFELK